MTKREYEVAEDVCSGKFYVYRKDCKCKPHIQAGFPSSQSAEKFINDVLSTNIVEINLFAELLKFLKRIFKK